MTKPITKYRKWLTFSAIPSRIFSISLWIIIKIKGKRYQITQRDRERLREKYYFDYSVMRTATLLLPPATSYHPISCFIKHSKNFVRMRVICRSAVWLKQSTHTMPAIKCNNDAKTDTTPYAIESLMISLRFSSSVAFVLRKKITDVIVKWKIDVENLQNAATAKDR